MYTDKINANKENFPIVSVVMPVFNRARTVKRSILSVLNQTYDDFEFLIIDDCSTDDTLSIIHTITDSRVRIFSTKENSGANVARNIGISQSRGKYIAFIDSDDCWRQDKLEYQLEYMQNNNLEVSFTAYKIMDEATIVPSNYLDYAQNYEKVAEDLRLYNMIGTPTLIVARHVLLEVGNFDEEMPRLQDYELVMRIVQKYKIGCYPGVLTDYNTYGERISSNKKILYIAIGKIIEKHYEFLDVENEAMFAYSYIWENGVINSNILKNILNECNDHKAHFMQNIIENQIKWENRYRNICYYLNRNNLTALYDGMPFVIWGAGNEGKRALERLDEIGLYPKYIVISGNPNIPQIKGIPVVNVKKIETERYAVIISVVKKTQIEILNTLEQYKFKLVITV